MPDKYSNPFQNMISMLPDRHPHPNVTATNEQEDDNQEESIVNKKEKKPKKTNKKTKKEDSGKGDVIIDNNLKIIF